MIIIVFALFLIAGFMVADAVLDYVFVAVYALAATAIINNIIHMIKYYKKHRKLCTSDLSGSFLYLLMGIGAGLIRYFVL